MSEVLCFRNEVIEPILLCIKEKAENHAFCIEGKYYTYQEFGAYVSDIRWALREHGCEAVRVGLVINNDIQTYASILALWLEGCCYVPLHPNWPLDRCEDIVRQVELEHIIDSSKVIRYSEIDVINTRQVECQHKLLDYNEIVPDSALAYILFTSGSTGRPKGVQITRENVAAFLNSFWKTGIAINGTDRCLQCFDLSFDVSVQSILVALTRSACVYTVPYGQMKFLSIAGLIEEYKITFGALPPSVLRYLQPYYGEIDFSSFRQCILTAEACPMDLVEDWLKYATNTEVYDFYGPTEATVYSTYYKIKADGKDKTHNGIISIGKPLANVIGIIVDEEGHAVSTGTKGELCLAGPQVSIGYWNDAAKNSQAFSMMEYQGENIRFYYTGDLCYQDEEGDILYLGRIDNQAKIQGFRVELSEIEFHARTFLHGTNVVCIACQNEKKLDEIVMFIESPEFETKELVDYMRTKMPQYMIPAKYVFVRTFPLNANGKTDRNAIKLLLNK